MPLALAVIVVAGVIAVLALALRAGSRTPSAMLDAAARYEAEGQFEDACYHYGIAAWRGGRKLAEPRVQALWRDYGPFSFREAGQHMRHSYCSRAESCGEGFHEITVREIRRIVSDSSKAPSSRAVQQ
jgi:hypothetical protein